MAKLTDEQLMILDNLIYLRDIANGGDEFENVSDFIEYISYDNGDKGRILNQNLVYEAEKAAKISTLEAAGHFDEATEVANMNQKDFIKEYIKDEGMNSYQNSILMA